MAPVDVGVSIGEERLPACLDEQEEIRLVRAVVGIVRGVPGDQMIGAAQPDAAFAVGIVLDRSTGQLLEGVNQLGARLTRAEEPHQVGDVPSVSGVAELDDVGERCVVDLADLQPHVEAIHRARGPRARRRRRRRGPPERRGYRKIGARSAAFSSVGSLNASSTGSESVSSATDPHAASTSPAAMSSAATPWRRRRARGMSGGYERHACEVRTACGTWSKLRGG